MVIPFPTQTKEGFFTSAVLQLRQNDSGMPEMTQQAIHKSTHNQCTQCALYLQTIYRG